MNSLSYLFMNDKTQKAYRIKSYDEILLGSILPMIEWNGLPDSVNERFIEYLRIMEGSAAIWKNGNDLICSHVSFGGKPYYDGFGSDAICVTNNGITATFKDWRNNPDIAIIFNDSTYSPDMNIGRFSDLLSEVETSMKFNVLYSRFYPIPIAKDKHMKEMIERTLNNMKCGQFATLLDENGFDPFAEDGNGIEILNLTDVSTSDKIQYLSHFRDDIFRWFYSLYGMNSQGSAKMAQQTVDEVNQDNNASMIIPRNRLLEAKKAVKIINSKFELNVSVNFSECWQSRMVDLDTNNDGIIDEESEENEEENENVD